MTDNEFIQVTRRELPYRTFDADNHLDETRDAPTKFLPHQYEGIIRYVDIDGRTKLANPTFSRVAVPGGAGFAVTQNPASGVKPAPLEVAVAR